MKYALTGIKQLVTCANQDLKPKRGLELNDVGIIENAAVVIENERIFALGSASSLTKVLSQIPRGNIYDTGGSSVIPGFVDSHTHVLFAGTREAEFAMRCEGKSYMEILNAGGGILNSSRMFAEASDETIIEQTRERLQRMLEYGTTSVEIKSGYGLDTAQEIRALQLITQLKNENKQNIFRTFLGAHAIPPDFKKSPDDFVRLVCNEMLPIIGRKKLADYCDVFCEAGVFDANQTEQIFQAAVDQGLRLRLHSDEIQAIGGTEIACAMGATSVDHLVAITEQGIQAVAQSKTIANLLPGTAYSLMKTPAPARRLIDAGAAVALSTDCNPGSCYTESMPMIISLACLTMKMSPEEALNAATFNGACALGDQENVGSIERGKVADLVVLDGSDYRILPYHFGVNPVKKVMRAGRWIN